MAYSHTMSKKRAMRKFKYRIERQKLNQNTKEVKKYERKLESLKIGR